jgi:hypothetical protein
MPRYGMGASGCDSRKSSIIPYTAHTVAQIFKILLRETCVVI